MQKNAKIFKNIQKICKSKIFYYFCKKNSVNSRSVETILKAKFIIQKIWKNMQKYVTLKVLELFLHKNPVNSRSVERI